jgi:hypothetical protein
MASLNSKITEHLRQALGLDVRPTPWREASRLAPFLSERYQFLQGDLLGHRVVFLIDDAAEAEPPASIGKHIALVRSTCDRPVIYVRESVTAYNRKRLIEQHAPFIVPGNQMYLPDLGIDLREHFRVKATPRPRFRPATQAVFIQSLLEEGDAPLSTAKLSPASGYSPITLSRAFDEIEAAGLAESRTSGRERLLHFAAPRRELWTRAQEFLTNPVKSRHFVHTSHDEGDAAAIGLDAGLSALGRYTMIAEPTHHIVAMSRDAWSTLRDRDAVTILPMRGEHSHEVEIWSYAPKVHRVPNVVDPLSLYLSLRASNNREGDERIAQVLEQLLESLSW